MTITISRNPNGYLADPVENDGITLLHVTSDDADSIESMLTKYGFVISKFRLDEKVSENLFGDEFMKDTTEEAVHGKKKKSSSKPKRMWVHKGDELKKILPEELPDYSSNGWKVGRKAS